MRFLRVDPIDADQQHTFYRTVEHHRRLCLRLSGCCGRGGRLRLGKRWASGQPDRGRCASQRKNIPPTEVGHRLPFKLLLINDHDASPCWPPAQVKSPHA